MVCDNVGKAVSNERFCAAPFEVCSEPLGSFIVCSCAKFYTVCVSMQSILPIVGLALCAQGAFAQTSIALTLPDAMQRARQYSQQVYTANLAALLAHEDAVQAKADLLPTAQAIGGYIYTQPNGTPTGIYVPNDGPHVYTGLLDLHGEVYNPARRAEYRRTMAAEGVAHAKRDLAGRGLVATVTQNFYAMDVA
jgi:outer membrane protein TolC